MPTLLQDIRFAVRTLLKSPAFSVAVIVTIALGVGATTAMWTVVDRVVLRPLPFAGSERAVMLCETSARTADVCVASPPNVADWAAAVPALDAVGVARNESFIASFGNGAPVSINGGLATAGFFDAIGLTAAMGRVLESQDLDRARNQVAVISDALWRGRFGGDPAILTRTITLDGHAAQIVGVLPPTAYIPNFDAIDIWKPITAGIDDPDTRNWRGFMTIGRMAPGVTLSALTQQLAVVRARLERTYPDTNAGWGIRAVPVRDYVVGPVGHTLWLFLGAVALVMLIACANVASLLLVRASARTPEFAVRASLGAGRGRLLRQVLTESLVISAAGGAGGLLLAMYITRTLIALAPRDLPRLAEVSLDGRVALFAIALTTVAAIVFGLAPARQASRARLGSMSSPRQTAVGTRARSVLVIGELALALVLLVGAGLLTRAFSRMADWQPGFDRRGVTVAFTMVPHSVYRTTAAAVGALEQVREQVAAVPGVISAGLGSAGPLFGGTETGALDIAGRLATDPDHAPAVNWYDADTHYIDTLGRRIVRGRGITDNDVSGAPDIAVVNEAFVARFFPGEDPIGRRVTVENHAAGIVGVVSDARPLQPDRATPPEIFWPIRQYPRFAAYLVMRLSPGVAGIDDAVAKKATEINPGIQVGRLTPIDRIVSRQLVSPRFNMALIGLFALTAIALAAVGVYGVVASSVNSRTRELGLRIALGATPGQLVTGVLRQALMLALIGAGVGIAGALLLGQLLTSVLHGVPVTDPLTLTVTISAFLLITATAAYIPARRASTVDPLTALKNE